MILYLMKKNREEIVDRKAAFKTSSNSLQGISGWILGVLDILGIGVTIGIKKEKSNRDWIEVFVATPGQRCMRKFSVLILTHMRLIIVFFCSILR